MLTLAAIVAEAKAALSGIGIDDPALEARMIVENFSATSRADAVVRPDTVLNGETVIAIRAALERRKKREPVHRIFGFRDFHGVRLKLSAETLEPRPDTETLVDAVLPFIRKTIAAKGSCRILDLGTGTGAIAVALLAAEPNLAATATDISLNALATATENARAAGVADRVELVASDWFEKIVGRYDAIVSNPPYISSSEISGLDPEVRDFDPLKALDGGPDGLDAYRAIAKGSQRHFEPGGLVAVEIGFGQRSDVTRIFAEAGYRPGGTFRDLAGTERVLAFSRLQ